MKKTLVFSLLLIQGFIFQYVNAQQSSTSDSAKVEVSESQHQRIGFGIGLKASTFGLGGEAIVAITPKFLIRVGYTHSKISIPAKYTDNDQVSIDNEMILSGVSLFANYQLAKGFFVTGGAIYNMIEVNLSGVPLESQYIGDIEATPEMLGYLKGHIEPAWKISPYAGIGFGRPLSKNGIVSLAFEAGMAFQGSPKITLDAAGMLTPTASEEQVQQINNNVAFIIAYPMMSLQLSIRIL